MSFALSVAFDVVLAALVVTTWRLSKDWLGRIDFGTCAWLAMAAYTFAVLVSPVNRMVFRGDWLFVACLAYPCIYAATIVIASSDAFALTTFVLSYGVERWLRAVGVWAARSEGPTIAPNETQAWITLAAASLMLSALMRVTRSSGIRIGFELMSENWRSAELFGVHVRKRAVSVSLALLTIQCLAGIGVALHQGASPPSAASSGILVQFLATAVPCIGRGVRFCCLWILCTVLARSALNRIADLGVIPAGAVSIAWGIVLVVVVCAMMRSHREHSVPA